MKLRVPREAGTPVLYTQTGQVSKANRMRINLTNAAETRPQFSLPIGGLIHFRVPVFAWNPPGRRLSVDLGLWGPLEICRQALVVFCRRLNSGELILDALELIDVAFYGADDYGRGDMGGSSDSRNPELLCCAHHSCLRFSLLSTVLLSHFLDSHGTQYPPSYTVLYSLPYLVNFACYVSLGTGSIAERTHVPTSP